MNDFTAVEHNSLRNQVADWAVTWDAARRDETEEASLAKANLYAELATETMRRLRYELDAAGIETSLNDDDGLALAIADTADVHTRVVLATLLDERYRYERLSALGAY